MEVNPPTKPTLGVCPEHIWLENRIFELCRAVSQRAEPEQEVLPEWLDELHHHLEWMKSGGHL